MTKNRTLQPIATFITFVVLLGVDYVTCERYYITPSQDGTPCPAQPCVSLNQYAANATQYHHTNTTLILLQGNHSLNVDLSISNMTELIMSVEQNSEAKVRCSPFGRLIIEDVDQLYINSLNFQQCGDNRLISVDQFLLEDSVFTGGTNTALVLYKASGIIRNARISDTSSAFPFGGAIICNQSDVQISNVAFERNSAIVGGAIYIELNSTVAITNSTFLLNRAAIGGALRAENNNNITVESCEFNTNGNSSFLGISQGGALSLSQSSIRVENSSFHENVALHGAAIVVQLQSDISIMSCSFVNNAAQFGGVLYSESGSYCAIEYTEFTGNTATYLGGVILLLQSVSDIANSFFTNNSAPIGGTVHEGDGSNINVRLSTFKNNTATDRGGVFSLHQSSVTISDSTSEDNLASNGGVMDLQLTSRAMIVNSTFQRNAAFYGGAISIHLQSRVNIADSVFFSNACPVGGVLYVANGSTLILQSSVFNGNGILVYQGISRGGVLTLINQSSVAITTSKFQGNIALQGAVLDLEIQSIVTINNSTFSNNSGSTGGVLYVDSGSSVAIDSSEFNTNVALEGGTINVRHAGNISITNGLFQNSVALQGGILNADRGSTIMINNSLFYFNTCPAGGVIYAENSTTVTIRSSEFNNNGMSIYQNISQGGVFVVTLQSSITIKDSTFTDSIALQGGTLYLSLESNANITNSSFSNSIGKEGGVLKAINGSTVMIQLCMFLSNSAEIGGALFFSQSLSILTDNVFHSNVATGVAQNFVDNHNRPYSFNTALLGGILHTTQNNSFSNNGEDYYGGAIATYTQSNTTVINCTFTNNTADVLGGALVSQNGASLWITGSTFDNNHGILGGALCIIDGRLVELRKGVFHDNTAVTMGGAMYTSNTTMSLHSSSFHNNNAEVSGGAIITFGSDSNNFNDLTFTYNSGNTGVVTLFESTTTFDGATLFEGNSGSLTAIASYVTISGTSNFVNCSSPPFINQALPLEQGGALTLFQSTLRLSGVCTLLRNRAEIGGGIYATESRLLVLGNTVVANSSAAIYGGGAYLYRSEFTVFGNCTLESNSAGEDGGGIYSVGSSVFVATTGPRTTHPVRSSLTFSENKARRGGAVYLKETAKLYTYKLQIESISIFGHSHLVTTIFSSNIADYGGAVYIEDDSTEICKADPSQMPMISSECHFQTIAVYDSSGNVSLADLQYKNMLFSNNSARISGNDIFGGLFDRCTVSPLAEVLRYDVTLEDLSGISYLQTLSDINAADNSIASKPVRVCFCTNSQPNCSYVPLPVLVKKGETFTISLVAVDQIDHPVSGNIKSYLSSVKGGLAEGQTTQEINDTCTELTFNIFSPKSFENLKLYVDGPCNDAVLSQRVVNVSFVPCDCSVGFIPTREDTNCECKCDNKLEDHIAGCDSTTETFIKSDDSWISFINENDPSSLVVHSHCPYNYCQPPNSRVSFNTSHSMCNFNRTGILCGACIDNYTLSLGSSRCLICPSYWPGTLVAITIAALIAGVMLVVVILVLNMTVAVGTINALVFYANIIATNTSAFFSVSNNSFQSVLTAWLNLNFGIDVCFFEGMDAYSKTWLKLAFPMYIILIVVMVIAISEYSAKFADLLSKRNPVAALATLILLSYTTFLQIIITALSFTILEYPDGSNVAVWLPDGNIKYLQGKHIALFIAAAVILLIGVPYTLLLFLWQWLVQVPDKKVCKMFHWITKNDKLCSFVEAYHAPYNDKHRYWTGLLLLVRVILYLISAVNISGDPQIQLTSVVIIIGSLLLLKGILGNGVYKRSPVDILESVLMFNILVFGVLTMYSIAENNVSQSAIAYVSTLITAIALLAIVAYHVYAYIMKPNGVKFPKERTTIASCLNRKKRILQQTHIKSTTNTIRSSTDSGRFHDIIYMMTPPGTLDYRVSQQQSSDVRNRGTTCSSLVLPDPWCDQLQSQEMSVQHYSADRDQPVEHEEQFMTENEN